MYVNKSSPGEKIAIIEEYEGGKNTFEDGHVIRSLVVGNMEIDKENRSVTVKNSKLLSIPNENDIVVGTVAAVMSSMIAVSIDYINGKHVNSHVECICQTRHLRKKNIALVNDIVTLKITSHLNGTIHASINEPDFGVLFTKCRKCGGKVIPMRDAIKCTECSWIDERKLSRNFGKSDFLNLSK